MTTPITTNNSNNNNSPSSSSTSSTSLEQPPIPLKLTNTSIHGPSPLPSTLHASENHPSPDPDSSSDSDEDQYEVPMSSPIRFHSIHHHQDPYGPKIHDDYGDDPLRSTTELERGELLGTKWKTNSHQDRPCPQVIGNLEWDNEEGTSEDEDDDQDRLRPEGFLSPQKSLNGDEDEHEDSERAPLVHDSHRQRTTSEDGQTEERRWRLKRRRKRKVYGGGRLDSGGDKEIWEVALGIASDILSPAPLFVPHGLLLLGLPLGLPVLFLTGFISWFSHVVLVVCGRYVGGRTYAQIASAAFPNRWKGFNLWFGESTVECWRLFLAGGRGMVNMMMVSDLFAQLTRQYTPKAAILYSRVFIIALVALLSLIPNFLRPRRPIFLPAAFPTLSRLPLFLTLLWPISIAIIGFRSRQLNKELGRKLPPAGEGDVYSEIMGGTVWGGFTIFLFILTTPQHTFTHLRSLKRVNKLPGSTTHAMVSFSQPFSGGASNTSDLAVAGPTGTSFFSSYTLRRYSWESAALLGVVYASFICTAWGLVGYLGMEHGGYEVNFLASLPSHDPWISTSRALLLVVLIPAIPLSLRPATTALFHLMRIPFQMRTASTRRKRLRNRGLSGGICLARKIEAEWDDEDEDEPLKGSKVWAARLVTTIVWLGVAVGAILLGGSNGGEGSSIEMLGCVGSTMMTGLLPACFFVILFHIRKARSIIITDPSSTSVHDELLLRKESQLQRRLSGRRLWQDVGVFGLLLPYCLVVLLKGLITGIGETRPGLDPQILEKST